MKTEIEDNIPMPTEKRRGRPRKNDPAFGKYENPAASLLESLKFVGYCIKKKPQYQHEQYCKFENNFVLASNDIITLGAPVQEDLRANPDWSVLYKSLERCTEQFAITQNSEDFLTVAWGPVSGQVPCQAEFETPVPSNSFMKVGEGFKQAILAASVAVSEDSDIENFKYVAIRENTAVGFDGTMLIEAYHGMNIPGGTYILLPKEAAVLVGKQKSPMISIGGDSESITFWFENGTFIRSKVIFGDFGNYEKYFPTDMTAMDAWPVPLNFFNAVRTVMSGDDTIAFTEEGISASNNSKLSYKIEGLPSGLMFSAKLLLKSEPWFERVCFNLEDNSLLFVTAYSENFPNRIMVRGVIKGMA